MSTVISNSNNLISYTTSRINNQVLNDNKNTTNSGKSSKTATIDKVEISSESRMLYKAAKSNNNLMDIAKAVVDIATDFMPGIGTAKDVYNLYKTVTDSKSSAKDVALALADLVPGPSVKKLGKLVNVVVDKFNLNSSTSKKLKDAIVKASAKKIKDIDISDTKKLVKDSENQAGHAIKDHVIITDERLQHRSKTEAKNGASKFTSQKVLVNFVNSVMTEEADNIAKWLKSSNENVYVSDIHKFKNSLGEGYTYNQKTKTYKHISKIYEGKLVLTKANNEYGYVLKTAYPWIRT